MIWPLPPPDHPRRQRVWRMVHWRRHRRFMAYVKSGLLAGFEKRMWSEGA